jgi:hypothetical protein
LDKCTNHISLWLFSADRKNVIKDIFRRLPKSEIILTMAVDHLIDYIRDPRQTIDKHPDAEFA